MKICSQCNRTYPDDNMKFCLSDGTPLVFDSLEEMTVISPPPPPPVQMPARKGVNPVFAYLGIGVLTLVFGGAVFLWIKSGSSASPNAKSEVSTPVTNSVEQKTDKEREQLSGQKTDLQEERALFEKEKQKLAEERKKLAAQKNKSLEPAAYSQAAAADPPTERIKFHRGSSEELISGRIGSQRKFVLRTMSGQYLSATLNSGDDCVVFDNGSTIASYTTVLGDSRLNLVNNCGGGAASFSMTVSVR